MAKPRAAKTNPVAGFIFITVILVAGLLCGTQSILTLRRDSAGAVTAVNEWRLSGKIALISRTVTPLMLAVNNKQNGLAVRLPAAGADIQAVDANGRTPLYLAASRGNSEMVRRLLREGADADQADAHGWTPLVAAAASEDTATVRALLDADADPGYKLPDGRRAIDLVSANEELWELLTISKPVAPLPIKE